MPSPVEAKAELRRRAQAELDRRTSLKKPVWAENHEETDTLPEAVAMHGVEGLTGGHAAELGGSAHAGKQAIMGEIPLSGIPDSYRASREAGEQRLQQLAKEHPVAAPVSELGGGLAAAGLMTAAGMPPLASVIGYGGLSGAGKAETSRDIPGGIMEGITLGALSEGAGNMIGAGAKGLAKSETGKYVSSVSGEVGDYLKRKGAGMAARFIGQEGRGDLGERALQEGLLPKLGSRSGLEENTANAVADSRGKLGEQISGVNKAAVGLPYDVRVNPNAVADKLEELAAGYGSVDDPQKIALLKKAKDWRSEQGMSLDDAMARLNGKWDPGASAERNALHSAIEEASQSTLASRQALDAAPPLSKSAQAGMTKRDADTARIDAQLGKINKPSDISGSVHDFQATSQRAQELREIQSGLEAYKAGHPIDIRGLLAKLAKYAGAAGIGGHMLGGHGMGAAAATAAAGYLGGGAMARAPAITAQMLYGAPSMMRGAGNMLGSAASQMPTAIQPALQDLDFEKINRILMESEGRR